VKRKVETLLALSLLATGYAVTDALLHQPSNFSAVTPLCRLTGFASPVWRVSWHEPRLRRYHKAHYTPYPEFPAADRLEFIYRRSDEP
jgi:hypothetical protein